MLILIMFLFFRAESASAFHFSGFDEGDKGIGLLVGSPLGVRYETWADWKRAYVIDAGYGAGKTLIGSFSHLWSAYDVEDYWRSSGLFNSLIFSYGLGAFVGYRIDAGDKTPLQAGVRGLVGFQHMFGRGNFSLRVEVGPALAVVGDQAVTVQGAIGLIYYFGGPIKARANAKSNADLEFDSRDFEDGTDAGKKIKGPMIPSKSKSVVAPPKSKKTKNKKTDSDSLDNAQDEFD
ncbi:MAG: hypothetical protein K2X47_12110 [Bdellovibrionales bacterium]|nr:hypothetical protein [Bdellovibrionales bacterium]